MRVTCLADPVAVLGEAPLWDVDLARLFWVDCDQKLLFELDPVSGAVTQTVLPHFPGSYAIRGQGGMVMAYRNGISLSDDRWHDSQSVATPGVDFTAERFNDGTCDRAGRFWVGTMDRRLREPVGSLFRLDADLSLHLIEKSLTCSNGIAFSPDDRTMYHTDTGAGRIYAYDYDLDTGDVGNRRVFVDFAGQPGRPDGCTIDAEGCLWVAEIGGGEVVRIDPDGRRIDSIELPVKRPTSAMFGGPDLKTLYVTTMRHGATAQQLADQPQSGCLFAVEMDVPGLPEARFAA
jgi:L-arabinonolactonase